MPNPRNNKPPKQPNFLKRRTFAEGKAQVDAAHLATWRLYCEALAFWRRCPSAVCKRHRRCTGEPAGCLIRGLPQRAARGTAQGGAGGDCRRTSAYCAGEPYRMDRAPQRAGDVDVVEDRVAAFIRPRDSGGGGPLELAKRANRGGGGAELGASFLLQRILAAGRSERAKMSERHQNSCGALSPALPPPRFARSPSPAIAVADEWRSVDACAPSPLRGGGKRHHIFNKRLALPLRIFALSSSESGTVCIQSSAGGFMTNGQSTANRI